jgi:L-amino acid N-acyltransferase YncA/8-oxo-dGTP pyrophosphatase MutT (NUDIX family)
VPLTLRPARSSDADAIWRIFHQVVVPGDTYVFAADTPRADAEEYFLTPGITTFVAELDGQVAGFYKLIPNRRDRGAHVANASFMVDPAKAARGIGYALGRHCLEQARQRRYEAMQFNFVVGTNLRAVALWQRLGFAIVATLPRAFRHATLGDVDAYVMHRSLDDLPPPPPMPAFGERVSGCPWVQRPSAYAIVCDERNRIALVSTPRGTFLPGGGSRPGESAEMTAVRETREECGLAIRTAWFIGRARDLIVDEEERRGIEKVSDFFAADIIGRAATAAEADHALVWTAGPEEAVRRLTRHGHIWAVEGWQRARATWPAAGTSETTRGDLDA